MKGTNITPSLHSRTGLQKILLLFEKAAVAVAVAGRLRIYDYDCNCCCHLPDGGRYSITPKNFVILTKIY